MRIKALSGLCVGLWFSAIPAAAGSGAELFSGELSSIFDSGRPLGFEVNAAAPVPAVPLPARIDIDEFCRGKGVCFLDPYVPAVPSGDRLYPYMQEFYENFIGKGQDLSKKERKKVEKGIENLNKTFLGAELCEGLSGKPCSLAELEKKNIIFKADSFTNKAHARTLLWGGKILILVNRNPGYAFENEIELMGGAIIGHELSHAEDYKKYKYGMMERHRIDTETKAYLASLRIYNELRTRYPLKRRDSFQDFLVEAWNWKEKKGAFPGDFKLPSGEKVMAADFIRNYLEPSTSGVYLMRNSVRNYFCDDSIMAENFTATDKLHWEMGKATAVWGKAYNAWLSNPVLYAPQSAGEPGNGGGTSHPPYNTNNGNVSGGGQGNVQPPNFGGGTGLDNPGAGSF